MTLRLNLDIVTQEDCEEGIAALTAIMPILPTDEDLYDLSDEFEKDAEEPKARACECDKAISDVPVINFPSVSLTPQPTCQVPYPPGLPLGTKYQLGDPEIVEQIRNPVSVDEARAAEQSLMTEAVQNVKRGRGRPPKNKPDVVNPAIAATSLPLEMPISEPATIQECVVERAPVEDDDSSLMDLISSAEKSWDEPEPDDIMALLGAPEEEDTTPVSDKYDAMDHETLYKEIKKRSSDDIRAPAIGVILREASQRDRKTDSVYKFTDDMLRNLLRIADRGLMKDISATDASNNLIAAWKETLV